MSLSRNLNRFARSLRFSIRRSASFVRSNVEHEEYLCASLRRKGAADPAAILREMFGTFRRRDHRQRSPAPIARIGVSISKPPFAPIAAAGIVRKLVHEFKYGRQRHLRHPLADWLGETLSDPRLRGRRFDMIVPVPLHPARERERGFNQAAAPRANCSARKTAMPVRTALERIRYTTTQTAFDRAERMENLQRCLSFTDTARTCKICGCC